MANENRVPVRIDGPLYQRIKAYSDVTGVPVVRVVNDALEQFSQTSLQTRLEALTVTATATAKQSLDGVPEIEYLGGQRRDTLRASEE